MMENKVFIKVKSKIIFYFNDSMIGFIEKVIEKRLNINSHNKPFFVYSSDDYGRLKNNC